MFEDAKKYFPIIYDKNIPRDKRHEAIVPLWTGLHKELVGQDLTKDKLRKIILNSDFYFRHGIFEFLKAITEHDINLVIPTAGIVGAIKQSIELLKSIMPLKEPLYFGTEEEYNDKELLVKFKEPVITTLNKSLLITHESCPFIKKGTNAILLGDVIDDLYITEKLQLDNIITIGFFNTELNMSKEEYSKEFDVTILNDGDLTYVTDLIKSLCSS